MREGVPVNLIGLFVNPSSEFMYMGHFSNYNSLIMSKYFNVLLGFALLGMFLPVWASHASAAENTACPLPVPLDQNVECGYLSVPEDHAAPNGPTIQIAYAVVHSHSPAPEPDPVIFLNGGPGGPMRFVLEGISSYNFLLASRDIVLFDPRGVDHSRPNLDCSELAGPFRREMLGETVPTSSWLEVSNTCRDGWLAQDIDLAQYNSLNTALDARDLWHALGYEKVNLFSLSYGTVLAQILMREDPQDLRAVVLDSPLPIDTRVETDVPRHVSDSLETLFQNCTNDFSCHLAYPDLPVVYAQLRDQSIESPVQLNATDPVTDIAFAFTFEASDLGTLISGPPRTIPAAIYDLHDGIFDAVIEQRQGLLDNLERFGWGHAFGLVNTVFCTEAMFYMQPGERASSSLPEAKLMVDEVQESYCQNWVNAPMRPLSPLPTAEVPTLILIGEYDTRLPVSYAQRIAAALPNSQWHLFPGVGHVVYQSSPCAVAMLTNFIVSPSEPLNTSCISGGATPSLDTRFLLRAEFITPFAKAMTIIFSVFILGGLVAGGMKISRQRFGIAWNMVRRRAGWLAPGLTLILLFIVVMVDRANLQNISADPARLFVYIISITTGIQAALLFAPDDEPAFEIQLAAARPLAWTILERFTFLLSQQILLGMLLSFVFSTPIINWLPPTILFAAIGASLAILTRRSSVGVLFVILVWFAAFIVADPLIQRMPILWIVHPFLEETSHQYIMNRWLVFLTGILMIMAVAAIPRKEENLLFGGVRQRGGAKRTAPRTVPAAKAVDSLPASTFQIRLAQLIALTRTELTLQWRRHSLGTSALALVALPLLGALVSMGSYQGYKTIITLGGLAAESAKSEVTFQMLPYFIVAGLLVFALLVPTVVADIIPMDAQIHVREIFDSLPMPRMIYLVGKVFAAWAGVLLMSAVQLLLCGAAWWILVAPFDLTMLIEVWATLVWIGLVNSASVMLLASRLSARRSVLVGVGYAFVSVISIGAGIFLQGHFLKAILPGRPAVVLYFIFVLFATRLPNTNISTEVLARYATQADILYAAIAGLAQVVLIGCLMWLRYRKED